MNLTFKGFARAYVSELTGRDTASLRRNLHAVLTDSPSAKEALWCYAASCGKLGYLCSLANGTKVVEEYLSMAEGWDGKDLEGYLTSVGGRYGKVWHAYEARLDPMAAIRGSSGALREKVRALLEEKGISAYKMFGDYGINRGNGYAWLRGDDKALSPLTAFGLYANLSGSADAATLLERMEALR